MREPLRQSTWLGFPDLVLAGAARSGTSNLAAALTSHSDVDGGAVKEPEFFSVNLEKGAGWYDGLYDPRRDGLVRFDASMSYTSPRFPVALARLREAAPHAHIVYAVRDPLPRAVSHFRLLSEYFLSERSTDFGAALRNSPVNLGAGDHARWLQAIDGLFPRDRALVVPFSVITGATEASDVIFARLGLAPHRPDPDQSQQYQNEVVVYRKEMVLRARRAARSRGAYPWLRSRLGPDRLRRLRSLLTHKASELSVEQALESCTPGQVAEIDLVQRIRSAVAARLDEQDERLGLKWGQAWRASFT